MTQFKINYLYEVLLFLLKKEAHGRELKTELKTSLTRIQGILNELRNLNVVDYKIEGKNHIYFLKKNLFTRSYILNAENYKLVKLIGKYTFLEPLFIEIINKYPDRMIILFGSYAKFIPKSDSDIDIYVNTDDRNIKKGIKSFYDKLSVKIGEFNKEDLLIKEIIKNHVIIQGGESFYEKIKFFR